MITPAIRGVDPDSWVNLKARESNAVIWDAETLSKSAASRTGGVEVTEFAGVTDGPFVGETDEELGFLVVEAWQAVRVTRQRSVNMASLTTEADDEARTLTRAWESLAAKNLLLVTTKGDSLLTLVLAETPYLRS